MLQLCVGNGFPVGQRTLGYASLRETHFRLHLKQFQKLEPGAYFQIFAENGAKLLSQKVQENRFYSTIDISALARGVYLLVYINGNENKVAKFTKMGK